LCSAGAITRSARDDTLAQEVSEKQLRSHRHSSRGHAGGVGVIRLTEQKRMRADKGTHV
jgi:hypothetical protein